MQFRWGKAHAVSPVPCVFLHSIGLPVLPTGAIVVVWTKHDIPRPRTASGSGGHYRPLLHKVFTTSMFKCVAYYRQMSSWSVWQAAQILLSALSHSSTGGLWGCGSFSGCYAGLHCSYSNAAYSVLQNGLALLWRSDYVWCECRDSYS